MDRTWSPLRSGSSHSNKHGEETFCVCKRPYNGEWMITCDKCSDWFHAPCVNLTVEQGQLSQQFYCPQCRLRHGVECVWKPKCRLSDCYEPARTSEHSKYCSDEHGRQFFRDLAQNVYGAKSSDVARFLGAANTVGELKELNAPEPPELRDGRTSIGLTGPVAEELQAEIANQERILKYLALATARKQRISAAESARTGRKKDICCMDSHLVSNPEYVQAHAEDAEVPDGENVCQNEQQKCLKHGRWEKLFGDRAQLGLQAATRRLQEWQQDQEGFHRHRAMAQVKERIHTVH